MRPGVAAPLPGSWCSTLPATAVSGRRDLLRPCSTAGLRSRDPQAAVLPELHPKAAPPRQWVLLPAPFRSPRCVRPCRRRMSLVRAWGSVGGPSPLLSLHLGVLFPRKDLPSLLWAFSHPRLRSHTHLLGLYSGCVQVITHFEGERRYLPTTLPSRKCALPF